MAGRIPLNSATLNLDRYANQSRSRRKNAIVVNTNIFSQMMACFEKRMILGVWVSPQWLLPTPPAILAALQRSEELCDINKYILGTLDHIYYSSSEKAIF